MNYKVLVLGLVSGCALQASIVNGNFATGDFTGWVIGGSDANGQILPNLGPFTPTGSNFALLSNGPGQVNDPAVVLDSTTLTSIAYAVSPGASLSIGFDFISEEPNDGTGNPDLFSIKVVGLSTLTIASGAISSGQSPISGGPVVAPDGSTFVYEDGFTTLVTPLSIFAGQNITIQFLVSDAVDNSFDSGLLLDNITGTGLSPAGSRAPEPSTMVIVGLATGLILARRIRT